MSDEAATSDAPRLGSALREVWRAGYGGRELRADLLAGVTVGVVAIPLAMALAIASGVAPQHGLYTAIVASVVIGLAGGSRVNISGPTAAFVVILLPIVHQYGLGGLLLATLMAGVILVVMGLARAGQLIEYIPYPVTAGFTAGIGVVIATLQLKDFLGLPVGELGGHYLDKVVMLAGALPGIHWADFTIGAFTLMLLVIWPRLRVAVPGYLVALTAGSAVAWLAVQFAPGLDIETIGSRFTYELDGVIGHGIPPTPPLPVLPWRLPGPNGEPLVLSFGLISDLLGPALAIAMLGAIESLLCAVVADGIAGTRHNPNTELLGQGLGNIAAPLFGGIPATAAIARTAANIRAGGRSPVSAIVHAITILAVLLALTPLLSHVPMAVLAAILMMVAWNMSDAPHFARLLRIAPRGDVTVLLVCFGLTVFFDMVLAVGVGVALAGVLFIRRATELTGAKLVSTEAHERLNHLPPEVAVYDINGPLFFGAAEKAIKILYRVDKNVRVIVIDMSGVSMVDITGLMALRSLLDQLAHDRVAVVIAGLSPELVGPFRRAGIRPRRGQLLYARELHSAAEKALKLLD